MIDVKELRIGNIVRHANANGTFDLPVTDVRAAGIGVLYKGGNWGVSPGALEGVPLTPELLERCGFVPDGDYWQCGTVELQKLYYGDDAVGFNGRPVERLHQLQNLYFVLIGEELDVSKLLPTVNSEPS